MKQNLIGGHWINSAKTAENRNSADLSDLIGIYAEADVGQVEQAVNAADIALPPWAIASPQFRANTLEKVSHELFSRSKELGSLLAREEGKTLAEAIGETVRAAQVFRFFAGEALRVSGEHIASIRDAVDVDISRGPVGVVGIITPWNFPIAIPAWKIAPVLAYGNTVVFKPAALTPGSAHKLAEIIHEAGCPKASSIWLWVAAQLLVTQL